MKSFQITIQEHIPEALKVTSLPSEETIREAAILLRVHFGPQLSEYLRVYGAISFDSVEFNGLTDVKKNNSSLIRSTVYFRDAFPDVLPDAVLLEDRGDGDYILCDSSDHIWRFTPGLSEKPVDSGLDFIDYTIQRHHESR